MKKSWMHVASRLTIGALLILVLPQAQAEPIPGLTLLSAFAAGNCVIGGMTENGSTLAGVCNNVASTGSYATLFLWGNDGKLEVFDAQQHGSFNFGNGAALPPKGDVLFLGVGGPGGDDKIELWDWNHTADSGSQIWIPSHAKGAYFIRLYGASAGVPNQGSYVAGIRADDDGYSNVDKVNYTPFRWDQTNGFTDLAKSTNFKNCGHGTDYGDNHFKSSAFITKDGATVIGMCQGSPYKWTEATGMQPFPLNGTPPGFVLTGIAHDGQTIIGYYDKDYQTRVNGVWTESGGWHELDLTTLSHGSKLTVTNVSNDGKIIGGYTQENGGRFLVTPFVLDLEKYDQGLLAIRAAKDEADKQAQVVKDNQAAMQARLSTETLPSPAEQAKYQATLTHGKAAQLYSMALDLRDQNYRALAIKLLEAIIEKYPDSEFAAKAIDLREQLKHGAVASGTSTSGKGADQKGVAFKDLPPEEQQRINAQLLEDIQKKRDQQAASQQQAAAEQQARMQACQSSCDTANNACTMDYANHAGQQLGNALVGVINHNAGAATAAGGQILGDPNACQSQRDACVAQCK